MILSMLAMTMGQFELGGNTRTLSGLCQYNDRVARYRGNTALIECNRLTIEDAGATSVLDFARTGHGSTLRVTGTIRGATMTVIGVTLRSGRSLPATGTCQQFVANKHLTAVSCLVQAGGRSYATNFIPSRL